MMVNEIGLHCLIMFQLQKLEFAAAMNPYSILCCKSE
jgi:hypothetical protein